MPSLRCCLVVELWLFWGDGNHHDYIITLSTITSYHVLSRLILHRLYTFDILMHILYFVIVNVHIRIANLWENPGAITFIALFVDSQRLTWKKDKKTVKTAADLNYLTFDILTELVEAASMFPLSALLLDLDGKSPISKCGPHLGRWWGVELVAVQTSVVPVKRLSRMSTSRGMYHFFWSSWSLSLRLERNEKYMMQPSCIMDDEGILVNTLFLTDRIIGMTEVICMGLEVASSLWAGPSWVSCSCCCSRCWSRPTLFRVSSK